MSKRQYAKLLKALRNPTPKLFIPWNDKNPDWHSPPEDDLLTTVPHWILLTTSINYHGTLWSIKFYDRPFFETEIQLPIEWTKGIDEILPHNPYSSPPFQHRRGPTINDAEYWWRKVRCRICIKNWNGAKITNASWLAKSRKNVVDNI